MNNDYLYFLTDFLDIIYRYFVIRKSGLHFDWFDQKYAYTLCFSNQFRSDLGTYVLTRQYDMPERCGPVVLQCCQSVVKFSCREREPSLLSTQTSQTQLGQNTSSGAAFWPWPCLAPLSRQETIFEGPRCEQSQLVLSGARNASA